MPHCHSKEASLKRRTRAIQRGFLRPSPSVVHNDTQASVALGFDGSVPGDKLLDRNATACDLISEIRALRTQIMQLEKVFASSMLSKIGGETNIPTPFHYLPCLLSPEEAYKVERYTRSLIDLRTTENSFPNESRISTPAESVCEDDAIVPSDTSVIDSRDVSERDAPVKSIGLCETPRSRSVLSSPPPPVAFGGVLESHEDISFPDVPAFPFADNSKTMHKSLDSATPPESPRGSIEASAVDPADCEVHSLLQWRPCSTNIFAGGDLLMELQCEAARIIQRFVRRMLAHHPTTSNIVVTDTSFLAQLDGEWEYPVLTPKNQRVPNQFPMVESSLLGSGFDVMSFEETLPEVPEFLVCGPLDKDKNQLRSPPPLGGDLGQQTPPLNCSVDMVGGDCALRRRTLENEHNNNKLLAAAVAINERAVRLGCLAVSINQRSIVEPRVLLARATEMNRHEHSDTNVEVSDLINAIIKNAQNNTPNEFLVPKVAHAASIEVDTKLLKK